MKTKRILSVVLTLCLCLIMLPAVTLKADAAIEKSLDNKTVIYNFLKNEIGLNTAAACGVLANIEKESSFRNDVLEYGYTWETGGGYGICQWTNSPRTANTGRRTNLVNWCNSNGYDYTSLVGQLYYLKYELNTSYYYKYVTSKLLSVEDSAQGAYEAAYNWCYYFEVPAGYNTGVSETRGNIARNTYWPQYKSSGGITESQFAEKIAYLKTVYRDKEYWNGYNDVGYEGTGTKKCYCTYSCAANCSCDCGKFYLNGVKYGGQCFGFANKMAYLVFGSVPDVGGSSSHGEWTYYTKSNNSTFYAGDYVRVRNNAHSIFVTAVNGDIITYVDCNNYGPCQVKWDRTISRSDLLAKTTYVYRYNGNTLAGTTHSSHSYTGSYYEAAHPHRVYQQCSCGATQYTGATKTVSTCNTCNPVSVSSKYNAVLPFKAYLKGASTAYPCTTEHLATQSGGEIWDDDECIITAVYSNGACKVKYPTDSGYREAYTSLSNFIGNTAVSLSAKTVSTEILTYIRASIGSAQYGNTDPGDRIYTLGTSGNMTQIFYPTPSGYKLAWVLTSELVEITPDIRFNPYCPIRTYPCVTADFVVYESDYVTVKGEIWTTDYCTINAVYADGWCNVTYPVGTSTKTGYTKLSNFVQNVLSTPVKYTANAQMIVSTTKALNVELGKIFAGDVFFVVGTSGSFSQVLYPLDAEYGGGYKMGWISTSSLPKTTYTVSYNANGGTGAPANQTKTHGITLKLSDTKPIWEGYTFVGWATSPSATSAIYACGADYSPDENVTLYAVWKLKKYEITYNANGGTNAPATQIKEHGTDLILSTGVPQKSYTITFDPNGGTVDMANRQESCKFLGWATSSSATSAAYQPGDRFTINANTPLYAVWQNPTLVQYSIPVRAGYVFDGWYTAANGGTQVTLSTVISSNMTVYAHWTIAAYGVHYDANGGSNAPAGQQKIHGTDLVLSAVVPTRENYTFLGWATEENPDEVQYQPGDSYCADNDVMLIAVWKCNLNPVITVGSDSGKPGETVTVPISIIDNPGITAAKLKIAYNSDVLSIAKVEDGGILGEYNFGNDLNANPYIVSWSNGATKTDYTEAGNLVYLTFKIAENAPAGEYPITVSHNVGEIYNSDFVNISCKFIEGAITVEEQPKPVVTQLTVTSNPTKTTYYIGDSLSTSGLELLVTYSDGSTETITSGFTTSGFSSSTAGTKTVTVSYEGLTDTFTVTVKTPSITLSPSSLTLTVGDSSIISATTIPILPVIALPYEQTAVAWISSNTNVATVSGGTITAKAAGSATITAKFTYNGIAYSATCSVTVNEPVATKLEVTSNPTKTVYEIGESLNTSGLKLKVTYSNGSTETITTGFTTSGFSSATAGTKTVTVKYGNLTTTFTVTVNELVATKLEVTSNPTKTVYEIGESLNTSGLKLKVTYSNGSTETITTGFTTSGFSSATAGTKTVTVKYGNLTTTFAVTVKEPVVDENTPQIFVESKKVPRGKGFTVTVEIKNNPGFSYLEVTPQYDSALTLVSVENGDLISDFTKGRQYVWVSDEDMTDDGLLLTFTFSTAEDIEAGNYRVSFLVRTCANYGEQPVNLAVVPGNIEVIDFVYGDATGDGTVDGFDVIRLKKYLANYDYDTETSTTEIGFGADANGDGKVDGFDVIRLKKYLADYDYETGDSSVVLGPQ